MEGVGFGLKNNMPTGVYIRSEEQKNKVSNTLKGRFTGINHPNWKGGISPLRKRIKNTRYFRQWRENIFKRDGYTCVNCKYKSIREDHLDIHVDHIKSVKLFPELIFDENNTRTLCVPCHRSTESWGSHQ